MGALRMLVRNARPPRPRSVCTVSTRSNAPRSGMRREGQRLVVMHQRARERHRPRAGGLQVAAERLWGRRRAPRGHGASPAVTGSGRGRARWPRPTARAGIKRDSGVERFAAQQAPVAIDDRKARADRRLLGEHTLRTGAAGRVTGVGLQCASRRRASAVMSPTSSMAILRALSLAAMRSRARASASAVRPVCSVAPIAIKASRSNATLSVMNSLAPVGRRDSMNMGAIAVRRG